VILVVALAVVGTVQLSRRSSSSSATAVASASTTAAPVGTDDGDLMEAFVAADLSARASAAAEVAASLQGDIAYSFVDLATGAEVEGPDDQEPLRSASIIKVAIAVAFLRQEPDPSEADEALLEAMIENSDNDAATTLYDRISGEAGLQAVLDSLGMTDTTPAPSWGFTTTTAADLAKLFTAVAMGEALPEAGTTRLISMMQTVEGDQTWGIADAVVAGTPVAVKNGWYPDTDAPVWRVNCGAIVGDATTGVVLTVTTSYPQSLGMAYGQEACERIAAALLPATLRSV
jgi:beta-lactamase class A